MRHCRSCRHYSGRRCILLGIDRPATFGCASHAAHATRKLSDADVRHIRAEYGTATLRHLARRYGVSQSCISQARNGRTWRSVCPSS